MKIIGITGGIGSGKSVVCKIFEQLKIPVYEADSAAKLLYNKYPELKQSVRELVSEEAIDKNGNINRKKLAEIVFNDEEKLEILNKLVHPLVKRDFENWVESHKSYPYVLKEAAILFESGANKQCDLVIAVISPLELRIERIRQRDKAELGALHLRPGPLRKCAAGKVHPCGRQQGCRSRTCLQQRTADHLAVCCRQCPFASLGGLAHRVTCPLSCCRCVPLPFGRLRATPPPNKKPRPRGAGCVLLETAALLRGSSWSRRPSSP